MTKGVEGVIKYNKTENGFLYYSYSGDNWNKQGGEPYGKLLDGVIKIKQEFLEKDGDINTGLINGDIVVEKKFHNSKLFYNLKYADDKEIDIMTANLIKKIFRTYKDSRELPYKEYGYLC